MSRPANYWSLSLTLRYEIKSKDAPSARRSGYSNGLCRCRVTSRGKLKLKCPQRKSARTVCAEKSMSRVHHQQGGEPSQRMLRVAELIRHTMAELLVRSAIGDPVLESQANTI